MNPKIEQAIALMKQFMNDVNSGQVILTANDRQRLNKFLQITSRLLQKERVTKPDMLKATQLVESTLKKIRTSSAVGPQVKERFGKISEVENSMADLPDVVNHTVEFTTLNEQYQTMKQWFENPPLPEPIEDNRHPAVRQDDGAP